MIATIDTSAINGLDAYPVRVEVQAEDEGKERFIIVGLGDIAIREAKERVTAAIVHSGFRMPNRVLVNLAPAENRKEGSSFDLAIALGILGATQQLELQKLQGVFVHGELALDGEVRPIKGVVAYTIGALQEAATAMLLPAANLPEAALISGIRLLGIRSLRQTVDVIRGTNGPEEIPKTGAFQTPATQALDDVVGQAAAKRAMLIAATGGHNLLMIGPPGCGKSMLAQRFASLLPPFSRREMLEAVRIQSIAGQDIQRSLSGERPFRAPHHNVSEAGLIGGGSPPRPGEISLAHHGVLFLDEFPEYSRAALEALRAPLENGEVRVTRSKGSVLFPAHFQLIAAMNPCPCGKRGSAQPCGCPLHAVESYMRKLSGPILDRIDLHVEMEAVALGSIVAKQKSAPARYAEEVCLARERQIKRQDCLNSELSGGELFAACALEESVLQPLANRAANIGLSARGFTRVLRVSRSIADLGGAEKVSKEHLAEALRFRALERFNGVQRQSVQKPGATPGC
jgi:magnesium chelatase family protein